MDPSLREEEEVFAALQAAAAERTVLLVIDFSISGVSDSRVMDG